MEANGDRLYIGAVVILSLATSAVSGLECYCGQIIADQSIIRTAECRQDYTCSISDTSLGQCSLEETLSDGLVTLRYTCLEVQATQIDAPLALSDICNSSTTSIDNARTSRVDCCVHRNYCNRDIQSVDRLTSQETPQTPSSASPLTPDNSEESESVATTSTESPNWTAGTIVIASLFLVTLIITIVVFVTLYILLRRRAAQRALSVA